MSNVKYSFKLYVSVYNWIQTGFFQVELKFPCIVNFAKVASL